METQAVIQAPRKLAVSSEDSQWTATVDPDVDRTITIKGAFVSGDLVLHIPSLRSLTQFLVAVRDYIERLPPKEPDQRIESVVLGRPENRI